MPTGLVHHERHPLAADPVLPKFLDQMVAPHGGVVVPADHHEARVRHLSHDGGPRRDPLAGELVGGVERAEGDVASRLHGWRWYTDALLDSGVGYPTARQ